MKIALAQVNPILADFDGNRNKIIEYINKAHLEGANMVIFPECALFGYAPFDLLERKNLVEIQMRALKKIELAAPKGMAILVGLLTKNPHKTGRPYFNSAALIISGKKTRYFNKTLLPTGDVFDEARFIQTGSMSKNYFKLNGKTFFVCICEDIWAWPNKDGESDYQINPMKQEKGKAIDLVINLSASPWHHHKLAARHYVAGKTAKHFKAPIAYVNMVGAQDEVIYDGRSFVMNAKGEELLCCSSFEEDIKFFNLNEKIKPIKAIKLNTTDVLRKALILGIRDFCNKTGLKQVHLGLSGGIDSAVVAALAVEAIGCDNVVGLAIPGPHSSTLSYDLAESLAKNLNIKFHKIEINNSYKTIIDTLEKGIGLNSFGITHENIQARLRGLSLMAYSNLKQSLLLNTSNKSEFASGYSTLYGDMCGGLCPIGDLTKDQVYKLANLYNLKQELIPKEIISRPPTAELRPNQKDQDSLPDYDLLDSAVIKLVEMSSSAHTKTEKWLLPILMRTEFKRWQAAPILKVSRHSFGRGRRYPIAHKAKEI